MSALLFPKPPRRGPKPRSRIRSRKAPIKTRRPIGTKRREAKAAGYVDPLTWLAVVEFYRGLCAYCEERAWTEQDHVYPISKGGPHCIENLVPACGLCNYAKGQSTRWQPVRVHPYVTLPSSSAAPTTGEGKTAAHTAKGPITKRPKTHRAAKKVHRAAGSVETAGGFSEPNER